MIFAKTAPVILRAAWIAAFLISTIWFLFWIGYDVLVWNKVISQVSPQNYIGLILSVALIVLGTQLGKIGIFRKLKLEAEVFALAFVSSLLSKVERFALKYYCFGKILFPFLQKR